jgi:PAS domain S-box-containing protein
MGHSLHVILLVVSVLITASLAGYAWRRDEHATRQFVALMIVFGVYSGAQLVGLLTMDEPLRLLIDKWQWTATATVPLFWLLFAVEYTGLEKFLTRKVIGGLAVIPVLTVLLAWTNPWHGLMWTYNALEPVGGLALLDQEFGPWFWVYTVYAYLSVLLGAGILIRLAWVSDNLYFDQSTLLIIGAIVPMVASILTVLQLSPFQDPTLDMTPYAFTVSGVSFGYAVFRHQLFDMIPAARQLGRRSAIQDLEDGVVITDTSQQIIYSNPAAGTLLEVAPEEALGKSIRSLLETEVIDFETEEALAKFERDGTVYEARTSPVYNRRKQLVGHTVLLSDVTEYKRREQQLRQQRDELRQLEELNSVLRGVNRVLVSTPAREEMEQAVCEHLAESELYETACIADIPSWTGKADRWTVAGEENSPQDGPTPLNEENIGGQGQGDIELTTASDKDAGWIIVPLVYRRTVYGALGLYSRRETATDDGSRERHILTELGATIGHAINALENRRLLSDKTAIELKFRSRDEDVPLLSAAVETDCQFDIKGIVPDGGEGDIAYVDVSGSPDQVIDAFTEASLGAVRPIQSDDDRGLLEWIVPEQSLVGTLTSHSLNVLELTVEEGCLECLVEVPSETEMRRLVDNLEREFPQTRLEAKQQREHEAAFGRADTLSGTAVDELTDKQREALEVAYRSGYFEWPRESSAEDVADTLEISRPTFQGHLRKAEDALLAELFDTDRTE